MLELANFCKVYLTHLFDYHVELLFTEKHLESWITFSLVLQNARFKLIYRCLHREICIKSFIFLESNFEMPEMTFQAKNGIFTIQKDILTFLIKKKICYVCRHTQQVYTGNWHEI